MKLKIIGITEENRVISKFLMEATEPQVRQLGDSSKWTDGLTLYETISTQEFEERKASGWPVYPFFL